MTTRRLVAERPSASGSRRCRCRGGSIAGSCRRGDQTIVDELCARYGGGGHAVVGGVTLCPDELGRARDTMASIVNEFVGA